MFVLFALMSENWSKWSLEIAISEWLGVFFILLFNASFAWEFGDSEFGGAIMITPPTQPATVASDLEGGNIYYVPVSTSDSRVVLQAVSVN